MVKVNKGKFTSKGKESRSNLVRLTKSELQTIENLRTYSIFWDKDLMQLHKNIVEHFKDLKPDLSRDESDDFL